MKNIIESIRKQYPVSDLTIKELESYLTPCSFPKKYQLIKEGIFRNSGKLLLVPYTKDFGIITRF